MAGAGQNSDDMVAQHVDQEGACEVELPCTSPSPYTDNYITLQHCLYRHTSHTRIL
jgi:hypothetical protein